MIDAPNPDAREGLLPTSSTVLTRRSLLRVGDV